MTLKEKKEKLKSLVAQSEAIRLKYQGKSETMSGQEEQEWTNILNEADQLKGEIGNEERHAAISDFAGKSANALDMGNGGQQNDDKGAQQQPTEQKTLAQKHRAAFKRFLVFGMKGITDEEFRSFGATGLTLDGAALDPELRAYQADNPVGGGFLQTPQEIANEVLTLAKDLVFIRGHATTFALPRAESLGIPTIETDPSDADWTSELAVGNEETTMSFGKRELRPSPLAKYVKVSNTLLRKVPSVEGYIMDRLGYKFGVTEEKAFMTGNGANQPLGIFTPSANGISTARDVTAANAASIVPDDLLNVVFSLKPQYRKRARWVLNRLVLKAVRKLKDGNNNYIWSTGLGPGQGFQGTPGTLLDLPYDESEYAPGTITTGLYTAILGDFTFYHIADALDMAMQVVNELFALSNQSGYILRRELDGMPVLEEAFARLIQA